MRLLACLALAGGLAILLSACSGGEPAAPDAPAGPRREPVPVVSPQVTVSADQAVSPVPPWKVPEVTVGGEPADIQALREQADAALEAGRLYEDADAALPILLALAAAQPDDAGVEAALERARAALLARGDAALAAVDADPMRLRDAHEIGMVARTVAPDAEATAAYLDRLDVMDRAQQANRLGEEALAEGDVGESGKEGALARFREALALHPDDVRARQGMAAAESTLLRRAEEAADEDAYATAEQWLDHAAKVRPEAALGTVDHVRQRIAAQRAARVGTLRDEGIAALSRADGLDAARERLAALLLIAPGADPAAVELRERIELATHYGLFRPGQVFTDALKNGGRGPAMVVVPHGAFTMGAPVGEAGSSDAERPVRNIRFDRGLAFSRTEVTVAEFRRFMEASPGFESRADRRGYSTAYDERSGNLVRRGGVGPRSDYTGQPAADDLPVIHVSASDADAYARWLSEQTGQTYRLASEAEFEYALRAGGTAPYPWGEGRPPDGTGNFTGSADVSPSGRRWRNAFEDYGDGAWGPAATGSYAANAFGLHDMTGNVSEWVADCWHDNYRRAPRDAKAWVNPGCRDRVVRGGAWASSPEQTRAAWRLSVRKDTTNARVGFRVVREI
ncbi:formylglycine-generating enzyme family protein [Lysobacter sp. SG-8]|uniref:Formylglycine-generating enzyme family protein n=1 Tax=Marilutibacter penaei TaxID=2759900 RepID=A0A7W3U4W0_9GAMM|nr:formylglycine-generating enzyme family protein [Lysobacter penaei]MBB1088973.1 formylglycine-generating enzyme family protein [Lysobacter penaei]